MNAAHVIAGNNAGVQSLREGNFSDASLTLKVSLLQLQVSFRTATSELVAAQEQVDDPMNVDETTSSSSATSGGSNQGNVTASIVLTLDSTTADTTACPPLQGTPIGLRDALDVETSDAYLMLYDRAFYLPENETRERVISSVILYNCALASHFSGLLRGNSMNLTNALRLYQYAYRILKETQGNSDGTELLLLALLNNMSHTSFQLFHLQEAEHYVKCLRDEMGLSESNPLMAADPLPMIEDEDYDFFCFNVTIRVEVLGAPAA